MTSHAAVVARGMGKPCVAGCEALTIDLEGAHVAHRRARRSREGDTITIDGGTGDVFVGACRSSRRRSTRTSRRVLGWADELRRLERARERRHARGRGEGARVRRRGHRPLPHRAHVLGRGAPAGRAEMILADDEDGAARGARPAAADAAGRLRGHLRGDGRAAGDDPAARPAAARVPAAARGGEPTSEMRAPHPRSSTRRTRCSARAAAGSGCCTRRSTRCRCARSCARRVAVRERTGDAPLVEIMLPLVGFAEELRAAARADSRRSATEEGRASTVPRRHDDRAAARVRPRRRDRRARGLLLVRHERPDADDARLLARRRRGQVPRALPRGRRDRAATRSRRSTRAASAS